MKPKKQPSEIIADTEGQLLDFLLKNFQNQSRTTVKSWLSHRQVTVNGTLTTLHSAPLQPGDRVGISTGRGPEALRHPMLRIVFEDEHLIVIDKRNGLLSISAGKEQRKTAFWILSEHIKRSDPAARLFVVHRLDRETSGLMLFAKSPKIQETLQRGWRELVRARSYVAVAEGIIETDQGTIDAPLADNKAHKVYVRHDEEGQDARTHFRVLRRGGQYTLLELALETGRKNQIRAHLEHIGHPVAGDVKYGGHECRAGRVCLHAFKLHVTHPVTGQHLDFDLPVPGAFLAMVK